MSNLQIANTIRQQLGNRFIVMTGAKDFVGGERSLSFKIGRNSLGVNRIVVTLNDRDLYDIDMYAVRGTNAVRKSMLTDIYANELAGYIGDETGMAVTL
jgi:hypothetical protein